MSDPLKACPDCGADIPVDGAPCGQKPTPPAPPSEVSCDQPLDLRGKVVLCNAPRRHEGPHLYETAEIIYVPPVVPPAPPGLDTNGLIYAATLYATSGDEPDRPMTVRPREILAALQQARKDERARIVKAVREKADKRDWPDSESYPDHSLSSAFRDAADFIETLEDV